MKRIHNLTALLSAAILGIAILGGNRAEARDSEKRPLFNRFYLTYGNGVYELTLRQERTFTLTAPSGLSVDGTIVASSKELALISDNGNRHFAFRFDAADNMVLEPTGKDTPDDRTVTGRMPPVGAGSHALFVASQNFTMPVAFPEARRLERRWDRPRGHYETRTEQVLADPARVERRWVPAQYEVRVDHWGHRENVLVRPGHYEDLQIPARYETRETRVWVEDR